jgi:5-methylthioadenosine/S-adenosylhomocysteine deaminase
LQTGRRRALVNQMILDSGLDVGDWWPNGSSFPKPLTTQKVLEYATINRARDLRLDHKAGSLTPGKEADIILLDAEAIDVAPLSNVPGALVSLMERSNIETVIVACKVRKSKGQLLHVDLPKLRRELEASRD